MKNIEAITKNQSQLRSSSYDLSQVPDTMMYIINLNNEGGFALMSADKRTEPIFALVDNGNYSKEDDELIHNESFKMFIKYSEEYFIHTINTPQTRIGSETELGQDDPTGQWYLNRKTAPKLIWSWNQDAPFNDYCPSLPSGGNSVVGCVAVALGYATAHFSAIESINGYPIDWDVIQQMKTKDDLLANAVGRNQVDRLLREIGRNVNMNYGKTSYATDAKAWEYLQTLDIKFKTGFRQYRTDLSVTNFYNCLRSTRGIIVMGGRNINGAGHFWVVDGIKCYKSNSTTEKNLDLYHCNWGYGGTYDGYYLEQVYNFINTFSYLSGGISSEAPSNVNYNYGIIYCALSSKDPD
ncbi:MAG TPA: hypothetical protein DDZ96_09595 [Porphyromonadaceae bacterium]|nr:hypothetical protein [Porphyromonadaceae bacterium]HBL34051.1 hypothetical protein [Porphyromonadaceae bacterium]HBX19913.1 hypothetical protein [Porphyromonadaceae bacterium]HBX47221.1 hypothetical protein [Porphyromonadaceae bacterium]HCM20960.1 hypothetical protein [Porphyromonadaceae bacterium]